MGQRISRIFPGGVFEIGDRLAQILDRALVPGEVTTLQVIIQSFGPNRWARGEASQIGRRRLGTHFARDRLGDVALQLQDILQIALVGVGPQMPVAPRLD